MTGATTGFDSTLRRAGGLTLLALLGVSTAAAEEPAESMFSLSGFGTLGVVHSSEHNADFGVSGFVPRGAGATREWSPEVDSRVGAQLTANFTPELSATLQLVSEQDHDGDYMPRVEWANIKYQVSPQFSVRLGRTALASFLVSDSRKVSYANPWVRPPGEVYGLVPIFSSDGVDMSYRLRAGEVVHTLLAGYGRTNTTGSDGAVYRSRDTWTLSDTVEYGSSTLRIAYQRARVEVDHFEAVFDGFRQFGPQGIALAQRYDPNGRDIEFLAIGGIYDPGAWFVTAEWGTANLRSAFGNRTSWYATGGYRIGAITPYVTYASTRADSNTSDPGLSLAGLPPDAAASAAALNAVLNAILSALPVQDSASVGARWDFRNNVALKLQYDRLDLGAGSAGVLGNVQPGFQPGGNVHLFSATIDFVW